LKARADASPLAELSLDWLASDAHPNSPGGLAPSTWNSYRSHALRHIGGHDVPDAHMTGNQAHGWPRKFFTPAVLKVAGRWPDEHGAIVGATPYSLRRGMISLRIRAGEDRQAIARQCGTSVEMLERSYSFAIEDLEDEGPKSVEEERLHARRVAVADYGRL
jgi:hypothetical protein